MLNLLLSHKSEIRRRNKLVYSGTYEKDSIMELLKDSVFNGFRFEIVKEIYNDSREKFFIFLRAYNLSANKNKLFINKARYISIEYGLKEYYLISPSSISYSDGLFFQPNSFTDIEISFESIRSAHDGDRIEIEFNKGNVASLLLIRENRKWYITEAQERHSINVDLTKRIEHFESIEEKFGLVLQNFSVQVKDECSLSVFCEILSSDDKKSGNYFCIEMAIYDLDNNIVEHKSLRKGSGDFMGFEVFHFGTIELDIPVEKIGKIRIYPTR